jgi:hypothetical protein
MNAAIKALYAQTEAIENQYRNDIANRITRLSGKFDIACPVARGKAERSHCPELLAVSHVLEYDGKVNEKRLGLSASHYAQEVAERWAEKLGKIGECESATVTIGSDSMTAEWTRNGRGCSLVSRAVYKVNAHGTAYYQYPTRIQLDGKSVTESEYAAAF